jgi:hypothetical protein
VCGDHERAAQWERITDTRRHAMIETASQPRGPYAKRAVAPGELEQIPAGR